MCKLHIVIPLQEKTGFDNTRDVVNGKRKPRDIFEQNLTNPVTKSHQITTYKQGISRVWKGIRELIKKFLLKQRKCESVVCSL